MTTNVAPEGLYLPTDITPEELFKAIGKLRRAAMDEIERLLTFLDSTEPDSDSEPSLGWTASGGHYLETPEDLIGNANAGDDREVQHDEWENEDEEPSLGWSDSEARNGRYAKSHHGGIDLEEEHDGCEPEDDSEPDVDKEHSLGWGAGVKQEGSEWCCVTDLEDGVGAVRKKRPASKTGGKVVRGRALPTIAMKDCERISV